MNEQEKEALLVELMVRTLPHTCETCGWMQPKPLPPLQGQKFCVSPEKITVEGSSCLQWKLEPDPSKRSVGGKFVGGV